MAIFNIYVYLPEGTMQVLGSLILESQSRPTHVADGGQWKVWEMWQPSFKWGWVKINHSLEYVYIYTYIMCIYIYIQLYTCLVSSNDWGTPPLLTNYMYIPEWGDRPNVSFEESNPFPQ